MKRSSGILVFKNSRVFLVRAAGPFDQGRNRWFIPKGEVDEGEDEWVAAVREWEEETGDRIRTGNVIDLGEIKKYGKVNHIFAVEQDAEWKSSNTFEFTFKNGTTKEFAETDAGEWFEFDAAADVLPKNQQGFIGRLRRALAQE